MKTKIHNTLWSNGVSDNEAYLLLVKYLLTKIYDENNTIENEEFKCQEFENNNDEEIYDRINKRYKEALKNRLNYSSKEVEQLNIIDKQRTTEKSLSFLVKLMERYYFTDILRNSKGKDILGKFFEAINRDGFKQSKGQFFTSNNIVKFIIYGLKLDDLAIDLINNKNRLPYVIDPSVGSGTYLIELMKIITNEVPNNKKLANTNTVKNFLIKTFPKECENIWAEDYLYGVDNSYDLAISTKVNMIMHGDGSSRIYHKDALLDFEEYKNLNDKLFNQIKNSPLINNKNVIEQFDAVISNPPFSVEQKEEKSSLDKIFIFGSKKNSENLFIERWYQLLKPNGRLGVVLPESVFDTTENKYIRLFLYKYFKIKAVVSLPQLAFEPHTSTKTSLLFAQKKTKSEIEEWNKLWKIYSEEWKYLKTRCENLANIYLEENDRKKLHSIKDLTEKEEKEILTRMLKDYIENDDKKLSSKEIVKKYKDELKELCKYDNDTKDVFKFVNTWWVFGEVAKELNYKIFMAEVENIGYKRTKRGEKPMPNELYRINEKGEVLVDDSVKETALDYLRDVKWD